ncbi:hypothetical protein E4U41_004721 [Claviceps citrina]|nr:hypothetical protein E4U41_004721 [Claviceps citrina]
MAPKPKPPPSPPSAAEAASASASSFKDRLGLGAYLLSPLPPSVPPGAVIYQTADFVAIHDKYPKSTVHTLLLPRSPAHSLLHPFVAFQDAAFLDQVRRQVAQLRRLVATELQRQLGRYSHAERARQAVLDGAEVEVEVNDAPQEGGGEQEEEGAAAAAGSSRPIPPLPPGRDWDAEIITGVHAAPSMSHLHIHVLSRDMHGRSLRHRAHYNSFQTGFLVDLADFPLPAADPRLEPACKAALLRSELRCWRCGRGFGNGFKRLKDHLEDEFTAWRGL